MANRITGMYSGMDTEGLINELMKAKRKKNEKTTKNQTKLEWKQEKWKELNTKLNKLMSNAVSNLRWSSSFQKKSSTSSSSAVSVITGEGAMNSVQNLSVKKLASSGYLTGAALETVSGDKAAANTKLSELKFGTAAVGGAGSFTVTANGKSTEINITADSTIGDVVKQLNNAGVSANFDANNQRIFVGATTSGKDADFSITANDGNANSALSLLGINAGASAATTAQYNTLKELSSFMVYNDGAFDAAATVSKLQEDTSSEAYKQLMAYAKADYKTRTDAAGKEISTLEADIKKLEAEADNATLTAEDVAKVNEELAEKRAAYEEKKANYDAMKNNLDGEIYDSESLDAAAAKLKDRVEYATQMVDAPDSSMINTGAVRLVGADAEIELNGVTYSSATNNVSVNGLTFTVNAIVDNVTITTQDDTSGIYDMIKSFVKEYNSIINEMDSLYNAEMTKIEPLTDEEREAVSDSEAEKLEKAVKDSLLRRDENLGNVFNGMREIMQQGFEVNGKMMYLSTFGISTGSYFSTAEGERNAFHIDGDPDDATTSGNADKLKSMIATDADSVTQFFTQLGQALYKKMQDLSASSDISSFGSFYDDKKLKTDIDDIKKKIAEQEEALTKYEDKYYAKFSAMEVALSKMQSKTDSISQLFSM